MKPKVYLAQQNIFSSLGKTSNEVMQNLFEEKSGLNEVEDDVLFPKKIYASVVNNQLLKQHFSAYANPEQYTKLEQLMISSLADVLQQTPLKITSKTGLIVATTKGNIDALDKNTPFSPQRAYLGELAKTLAKHFNFKAEPIVLSNACVSGILAIAVAKKMIQAGIYEHVFVVGGDLVSKFTLSGFNSFQALSSEMCKPYSKNRLGINLGEAAASILVTQDKQLLPKEAVRILGEGSCNDANHISGPSRTGEGLYRSMQTAFQEAKIPPSEIDYISAHGTATLYNDEMEAIAMNRMGLQKQPLNSLKAYFGHTLGASGLIETIVGMHSLHQNKLIKSLGFDALGVSAPINIIKKQKTTPLHQFLKTASGFGGCNTAMIFQKV